MKHRVFYNTDTGAIIMTQTVTDENEPVNGGLIVDIPKGKELVSIDPETAEPIFKDVLMPVQDVKKLVGNLEESVDKLKEKDEEFESTIDSILTEVIPSIMGM